MAKWIMLANLLGLGWGFCTDGIGGMPDFAEDGGAASVEVISVQAALFSINPKIGQLFGRFNWFHSALVFKQSNGAGNSTFWTLEFDATTDGSTFAATVPAKIDGANLTWGDTGMKFCLTEGILWGRDHWKKSWETVMTLTAEQARRTFDQGIGPINATRPETGPQYQLFAVETSGRQGSKSLVKDMTCGDGVSWFLYYAATLNNVAVRSDFRLRATHITFNAKDVVGISVTSPEWHSSVVKSYRDLFGLFNDPIARKPLDLLRYVPVHGVYDANSGKYYKIEHNRLPFVRFLYVERGICSPPWVESPECLEDLPSSTVLV